jgi:hypothetical protein
MKSTTVAALVALSLVLSATAKAGIEFLPTDLGLELIAAPTSNLVPGQVVEFAVSASNYGPLDLAVAPFVSQPFANEFRLTWVETGCSIATGTGADGKHYLGWNAADDGSDGRPPPLLVGETRTCRFQITLTATAPTPYRFYLELLSPPFFDLNATNDGAAVDLTLVPDPISSLPTLSDFAKAMLVLLLAIGGAFGAFRNADAPPAKRAYTERQRLGFAQP